MEERVSHPFQPVYDGRSKILILGSFPSVRSRETGFYYGHPTNRFWRVLSAVLSKEAPATNDEKRAFLLENRIALWDVARECDIENSADATLKRVVPNDIGCILEKRAFYECIKILQKGDAPGLIYSDEDSIDALGKRTDPFFKPDYAPDLLMSCDYFGGFVFISKKAYTEAGGIDVNAEGDPWYDLWLRISEKQKISHIKM